MKRLIWFSALAIVFSACRKDTASFNAYFYAKGFSNESALFLYVDGDYRGTIPVLISAPACGDSMPLHLLLPSGKYRVSAKDAGGNIRAEGTIKFRNNSLSSETGRNSPGGGIESYLDDDCLRIGILK